tara:strand:+ start:224 stop:1051 length:828 start_codon:yes stop_codon:yes gene_type:complete
MNKKFFSEIHNVLTLEGDGVKSFLHGQTTSNLLAAQSGEIIHSCWLNTLGRVRAILEIHMHENKAKIICLAGQIEDIHNAFERMIFPADNVNISKGNQVNRYQIIDLDQSDLKKEIILMEDFDAIPVDFTDVKKATSEELQRFKLETGFPLGPGEINGKHNPFEIGLEFLVDMNKGCYLGQETIARLSRNSQQIKKLFFWQSENKVKCGDIYQLRPNKENDWLRVGVITSCYEDVIKSGCLGLAIIKYSTIEKNENFFVNKENKIILKEILTKKI